MYILPVFSHLYVEGKKKEQNVEDLCKTLPVMAVYGDHVTDVVTT